MSARRQIIAALSEDSLGGIATMDDVAHAEQLVNALAAEVRRDDADSFERYPWHSDGAPYDNGRDAAITWVVSTLRRRAEVGEKASAPAPTATPTVFDPLPSHLHAIGQAGSEYEQALYTAYQQAITEVARLQAETGADQPTAGEATPDFFQPGHTYADPSADNDWKFRVDTITTHPEDGERTALGWRHFRGEWTEQAYDEGDFEIHLLAGMTDGGDR